MGLMKSFGPYLIMLLNDDDKGAPGDVLTRVGEEGLAFSSGGGGNPFNQNLNTSDSPTFDDLTLTGGLAVPGSIGAVVAGSDPYFKWDAVQHAFSVTVQPPILTVPSDPTNYYVPTLAGDGAGNLSNGTYRYKFTFVTPSGETLPSTATDAVTVTNNAVNGKVSLPWPFMFDCIYASATRIYRTVANGSAYKFHSEIDYLGSLAPITDNTSDASLGADAPTVSTAIEPGLSFTDDGGLRAIFSPSYGLDVINLVPTRQGTLAITICPETSQLTGVISYFYGGGAVNGQAGSAYLHGGDVQGTDLQGFGFTQAGDAIVAGGLGNGTNPSHGGNAVLIPGSKSGADGNNGEVRLKDADSNNRVVVDKDGNVIVNAPNWGVTSGGVLAVKNAVTAGVGVASTNRIQIVVDGTTYYLLATTVA